MPTMLGPAIDPTSAGPVEVATSAGPLIAPVLPPVEGPGDPEAPYAPVITPVRMDVEIRRAISHDTVGFLTTAIVEDWVPRDVELLAGTAASITASSWDPLWRSIGAQHLGPDGLGKATWDPKGYEAVLYRDGLAEAPYIFMQPVDIGGGRVALPAIGPQEQVNTRFLGRPQQVDLLEDKGSFESYTSIAQMESAGWFFPDGVTATLVSDGVRDTRALRVTGDGWVRSPRITVDGAAGYSRIVDGFVFGKWSDTIPADAVVAKAATTGTSFGAPIYDSLYADENAGRRPDEEPGWTENPIVFAARLAPTATAQRAYLTLRSFDVGNAYYDLAQLRLSVQTGFPPGTNRDLSEYMERIHRDSVAESLGGYADGLTVRIDDSTGVEASQRWAHAARTPLRDVYAVILDADGGPECYVTPNGKILAVTDRLGSDRTDIAIGPLDVVDPSWTTDPTAQIDDYVVDTGRGSGVSWLAAVAEAPRDAQRHRVQAIVQGPTDRTLNEIESWKRAHARAAARLAVTAKPLVRWVLADQISVGDTLLYVPSDGHLGESRRMRVLRKRYIVASQLCEMSLGPVDA